MRRPARRDALSVFADTLKRPFDIRWNPESRLWYARIYGNPSITLFGGGRGTPREALDAALEQYEKVRERGDL